MKKNMIVGVLAVVIVASAGGLWLFGQGQAPPEAGQAAGVQAMGTPQSSATPELEDPEFINPSKSTPAGITVKEFTVTGGNYSFSPAAITVNKGDIVRITFKNAEGRHNWKLDEFDAATQMLQSGQQEVVEFVAAKTGPFEYYCSVGNHRAMGMKGTLTVK